MVWQFQLIVLHLPFLLYLQTHLKAYFWLRYKFISEIEAERESSNFKSPSATIFSNNCSSILDENIIKILDQHSIIAFTYLPYNSYSFQVKNHKKHMKRVLTHRQFDYHLKRLDMNISKKIFRPLCFSIKAEVAKSGEYKKWEVIFKPYSPLTVFWILQLLKNYLKFFFEVYIIFDIWLNWINILSTEYL